MNPGWGQEGLSAVLLDIEGTTTPVDFVHNTLFSFARQHMNQFLQGHWKEESIRVDIAALKEQHSRERARGTVLPQWAADSPEAEQAAALDYMNWLMDRDVKCTPLKSLQGRIWQDGYRRGKLRAEVYPDVPLAFRRWSKQHRPVLIFSSGSTLAQKLLFENTTCGDLSGFLLGYFDTTTGSKVQCESYRKISSFLSRAPASIIFVSDTLSELDAAIAAGMQTALCVREGSRAVPASRHSAVCTLDEIFPEQA
jgi:enolase-phosphatase E1